MQVAIKNSIDIFYFACIAPLHIFFSEDGKIVITLSKPYTSIFSRCYGEKDLPRYLERYPRRQ